MTSKDGVPRLRRKVGGFIERIGRSISGKGNEPCMPVMQPIIVPKNMEKVSVQKKYDERLLGELGGVDVDDMISRDLAKGIAGALEKYIITDRTCFGSTVKKITVFVEKNSGR